MRIQLLNARGDERARERRGQVRAEDAEAGGLGG
jgi:hypothetical protein